MSFTQQQQIFNSMNPNSTEFYVPMSGGTTPEAQGGHYKNPTAAEKLGQIVIFPTSEKDIHAQLNDREFTRVSMTEQSPKQKQFDLNEPETIDTGYWGETQEHNGITEAIPMSEEVLDARIEAIRSMTPEQISRMVRETSHFIRAIRTVTLQNANNQ